MNARGISREFTVRRPGKQFPDRVSNTIISMSEDGDGVVLDMFSTITSPKGPANVDFQDSRFSDTISRDDSLIYSSEKIEASRSAVKFMKKWYKWILSLCIVCVLILSLTLEKLDNILVCRIEIWKWCLFASMILHGIKVTGMILKFLLLHVISKIVSSHKSRIKYFYFGMKNSLRIFIWLVLVLLTWLLIFMDIRIQESNTLVKVKHYVTWTLVSAIIGAFLWIIKTLVFRSLSTKFLVFAFFTRIQESLFHQYVINTLTGPPLMEFYNAPAEKVEVVISVEKPMKVEKEKVSAEIMEALVKVVCSSGMRYYSASEELEVAKEITSEMEATAAAFNIFRNVAKPGSKYIDEDDLFRFLMREEVNSVLPLFEGAKGGQISRKFLIYWVVKVYNSRQGLIHSLTDTKKSIKQLNTLVIVILIIIEIVVWLLLTKIATTTVLVFLTSQLVLAAFIFGDTCKRVFESVLFLFVLHPFDIGDRCIIDDLPLLVEEMNILTTVFLKLNNEIVYYPNSQLSTKPIINLSRSNLGDVIQFLLASVPKEEMVIVQGKIKSCIEEKPQNWSRSHNVVVTEIDNDKSKLELYFSYVLNFAEFGEKTMRRSELVVGLIEIFEQLNIKYSLIPQPNLMLPD